MAEMKEGKKMYGMRRADFSAGYQCCDLVDEVNRMRAVFPDYQWSKNMIEPHPRWNGRECIRLAPGVIRFLDERSPKYHLIAEWRLVES